MAKTTKARSLVKKTNGKKKTAPKVPHKQLVRAELERLREANGGEFVPPASVVEYARTHRRSALHKEFEWDNNKAAHQHRLEQARHLIRLYVNIVPNQNGSEVSVPMYVSLVSDRGKPGRGYRTLESVMSTEELREELLQQALDELQRVRKKYQTLQELGPVFAAIDRVAQRNSRVLTPA
jgi:hypothetical protein